MEFKNINAKIITFKIIKGRRKSNSKENGSCYINQIKIFGSPLLDKQNLLNLKPNELLNYLKNFVTFLFFINY